MRRVTYKLPQPTILDRVIGEFSPGLMNRRLQEKVKTARYQALAAARGGYDGADRGRRAMRHARRLDGSADSALLPVADDLRVLSSDAARNNPLVAGAFDTIATKVVGPGLQLQARVDRKVLGLSEEQAKIYEETFERYWRHLSERIDYRREQHFNQLEYVLKYSTLEMGDAFVLKTRRRDPGDLFDLKIQLIEAPLVCNENRVADSDVLAGGIGFANGIPAAVHIANRHPLDITRGAAGLTWRKIPIFGEKSGRRNILHLKMPTRINQTRGVPLLAPVIEALKQLGDWSHAELTAAVMNSVFAIVSTTEGGSPFPETGEQSPAASDGLGRVDLTLEPGLVLDGMSAGEKVEGFAATRPNPDFDPFFVSICRQIAVALGLSFELLVRHFTASYSASRAALMQVWEIIVRRRAWFARVLHQDLYEEMIAEAFEKGLVSLRGWTDPIMRAAWCKARWIGPSQGQLNPVHEVNAAKIKVDAGFSTVEEQTAEICGGDFDANMEQRAREIRIMAGMTAPAAAPIEMPDDPNMIGDDADEDTEDETREPG